MGRYRANSKAFQARWHRQLASDLIEVGNLASAADRIQRAQMIEQELLDNRQCKCCGRHLKDDDAVDSGYGADCRRKMREQGNVAV